MKQIITRRLIVAVIAIGSLTFLGATKLHDVSMAIASIAIAVAGAGAYEVKKSNVKENE